MGTTTTTTVSVMVIVMALDKISRSNSSNYEFLQGRGTRNYSNWLIMPEVLITFGLLQENLKTQRKKKYFAKLH